MRNKAKNTPLPHGKKKHFKILKHPHLYTPRASQQLYVRNHLQLSSSPGPLFSFSNFFALRFAHFLAQKQRAPSTFFPTLLFFLQPNPIVIIIHSRSADFFDRDTAAHFRAKPETRADFSRTDAPSAMRKVHAAARVISFRDDDVAIHCVVRERGWGVLLEWYSGVRE